MSHWVLIAEDDEHIARLIDFKLRKSGYETELARNGQEAVSRLAIRPWSLLVLDVMMPLVDGWTVLKRAREMDGLARVPVLMLTAKSLQGDHSVEGLVESRSTQVMRKPFDPAELSQRVASMIEGAPKRQGDTAS